VIAQIQAVSATKLIESPAHNVNFNSNFNKGHFSIL